MPSIATLEAICRGFGISMAQFFAENEMVELTPQTRELFECWRSLTSEQKEGVLTIMRLLGKYLENRSGPLRPAVLKNGGLRRAAFSFPPGGGADGPRFRFRPGRRQTDRRNSAGTVSFHML